MLRRLIFFLVAVGGLQLGIATQDAEAAAAAPCGRIARPGTARRMACSIAAAIAAAGFFAANERPFPTGFP